MSPVTATTLSRAHEMARLYYDDEWTMEQIGARYEMTRERVRQLLNLANAEPVSRVAAGHARRSRRIQERHKAVLRQRRAEILAAYQERPNVGHLERRFRLPRSLLSELLDEELTRDGRRAIPCALAGQVTFSDEEIVDAVRACAAALGETPTTRDYGAWRLTQQPKPASRPLIYARMGWAEALRRAGMEPRRGHRRPRVDKVTVEEAQWSLGDCVRELGLIPTSEEYDSWSSFHGRVSLTTVRRLIGPSWAACVAYMIDVKEGRR
jgi:hypothetical protein